MVAERARVVAERAAAARVVPERARVAVAAMGHHPGRCSPCSPIRSW